MLSEQNDQAAGLRRLFRASSPRVVGLVPCSAAFMPAVAPELSARARKTGRILVLDETCGSLAESLKLAPRRDLLEAAQGHVGLGDCLVSAGQGLHMASVSGLAGALGRERMLNQRILRLLKGIGPHFDECFIVAGACGDNGISPLLYSVSELVLVAEGRAESATLAFATLKRLREQGSSPRVSVLMPSSARGLAEKFGNVAKSRLGLSLRLVCSFEDALRGGGSVPFSGLEGFLERLAFSASLPVKVRTSRSGDGSEVLISVG